jgi:hypothetical protein
MGRQGSKVIPTRVDGAAQERRGAERVPGEFFQDQQPIETLGTNGAHEPLRHTIRLRGTKRRANNLEASTSKYLVKSVRRVTTTRSGKCRMFLLTARPFLAVPSQFHARVRLGIQGVSAVSRDDCAKILVSILATTALRQFWRRKGWPCPCAGRNSNDTRLTSRSSGRQSVPARTDEDHIAARLRPGPQISSFPVLSPKLS